MFLTDEEKRILDGSCGAGRQKAMEMLYALGVTFEAEKLIPITRAHVSVSGQEGDTYWCETLVRGGAKCVVPPSTNPYWDVDGLSKYFDIAKEDKEIAERTGKAYAAIGAMPTFHCVPELGSNVPEFGEHIAFSESSAAIYANSVLGARTNRESSISALASSVIGKTPYYGYHLDEFRSGDILIDVQARLLESYDWGLLGCIVGRMSGTRNPVLRFEHKISPSPTDLLYFGAEAATSGTVTMFHIIGVTPEAPTAEAAFGKRQVPAALGVINSKDISDEEEKQTCGIGDINLVMLGCPHYEYGQLEEADMLLGDRKVSANTAFWIMAAPEALKMAQKSGLDKRFALRGVNLAGKTCIDEPCWKSFDGGLGLSDSPKCAYYREHWGQKFAVRRLSVCIDAAVKGRLDR